MSQHDESRISLKSWAKRLTSSSNFKVRDGAKYVTRLCWWLQEYVKTDIVRFLELRSLTVRMKDSGPDFSTN